MGVKSFDQAADTYDQWYLLNPVILRMEREAISRLGLRGLGLDVGCGTGVLTPSGTIGLDPSIPMLRRARSRGLEVVKARAEHLPFSDATFDYLLMTAAISFFQDREATMEEAGRVLRHGGIMGVCILNANSSWGEFYARKGREGHPIYSSAYLLDVDELGELMARHGMEVDITVSCLHRAPGESLEGDQVVLGGDDGGFVCARGMKGHARG